MWGTGQPTLAQVPPELAAQRHPSKHGDLAPTHVTHGSGHKVWWLCEDGQHGHQHAWQARVRNRVYKKHGYPTCSGREPCQCNSLAASHSQTIQQQWDSVRNKDRPEELLPQSTRQVHWRCTLHSPPQLWTARPNNQHASNWVPSVCKA